MARGDERGGALVLLDLVVEQRVEDRVVGQ